MEPKSRAEERIAVNIKMNMQGQRQIGLIKGTSAYDTLTI